MIESVRADVVIVSIVGGNALRACLERLAGVQHRCVVVLNEAEGGSDPWQQDYPDVKFITASGAPIPLRRQRGVEACDAGIVALLEDTSLPDPGWYEAVASAFLDPAVAAAGGPVRISPRLDGRYQALGCGEYGRYHPQRFPLLVVAPGSGHGLARVSRLPGNNLAYRRDQLLQALMESRQGLIEGEVNAWLQARDLALVLQPEMSVEYAAADRHGARLGTRVQHGRLFASGRVAGQGLTTRLVWTAKAVLLPALLTVRALSHMMKAVEPASWLPVALWIAMLECAWALGEGMGYLAGGGRSLEAWR